MDPTQQFVTKVDNLSAEEAQTNFLDLFNEALTIEVSQWQPGESHEPGSASGSLEPSSLA